MLPPTNRGFSRTFFTASTGGGSGRGRLFLRGRDLFTIETCQLRQTINSNHLQHKSLQKTEHPFSFKQTRVDPFRRLAVLFARGEQHDTSLRKHATNHRIAPRKPLESSAPLGLAASGFFVSSLALSQLFCSSLLLDIAKLATSSSLSTIYLPRITPAA